MPPRKISAPSKAPESVICRLLSKVLLVGGDDIYEVIDAYLEDGDNVLLKSLLRRYGGLYPWVVDVPAEVMRNTITPLVAEALSLPGSVLLVKDRTMAGPESLWLVAGEPTEDDMAGLRRTPHRGLTHAFRLKDGDSPQVLAIQIDSFET